MDLYNEFENIEKMHYELINKFIIGFIKLEDVDLFAKNINSFKEKLYTENVNKYNPVDVANMKSKISHMIADSLEDEELLIIAHANSQK